MLINVQNIDIVDEKFSNLKYSMQLPNRLLTEQLDLQIVL